MKEEGVFSQQLFVPLEEYVWGEGEGRGGDGNKLSPSESFECNYQFYLRILSCMLVCCDITVSNTGEDGKTVPGWPPTSKSVLSTEQYFVSRAAAN